MKRILTACAVILSIVACTDQQIDKGNTSDKKSESTNSESNRDPIFRMLSSSESGIEFYNNLTETQEYNYFRFQYTYNGAGVAVGDLDNDGLDDIYLVGNQVQDRLYHNQGGLQFTDITSSAGIHDEGAFNFGVTMADVNADGWMDIYVCRSGHGGLDKEMANLLYINNGNLTFTESASAYGLADTGHSIQSAFFDYDKDGDLDVYLTNHPVDYGQNLGARLEKMKNPAPNEMDRLYRNNGDNTFTDVTRQAGLVNYGHGLGLIIWDIDRDGWDDIIVANDYQSSDWFYINNGDGTFTDKMKEMFPHIPYYSMGIDAADINNDGLMDLHIVEMLPENYKRRLLNLSELSEKNYYVFEDVGFHHQYTRNGLFLNSGVGHFGDIALMTGMEATDWSWATLIADFDNDGNQDVFVANGYLRDMQDKDYIKKAKLIEAEGRAMKASEFNEICKSQKLRNYLYLNKGSLEFENVAKEVGMEQRTFTSGAAYSDLDNDGDLDLVLNNVNLNLNPDPAFLYENLSTNGSNFLTLEFKGPSSNPSAEGVKAIIHSYGQTMIRELRRTRGFESAVSDKLHFGIGDATEVEDLTIIWPDKSYQVFEHVAPGSKLLVDHAQAKGVYSPSETSPLMVQIEAPGVDFAHKDKVLNEFDFEKQLPFRLAMQGPGADVGDVNGDGLDDIFITAAHDLEDALFLQTSSGFTRAKGPWEGASAAEDVIARFVDVDGDGDLDLFVGAGGVERGKNHELYLDRLYINDGKAGFSYDQGALPRMLTSTSCVTFGDMDGDGDQDAFIGSRSVPGAYGEDPNSYLLLNEGGRFQSIGDQVVGLRNVGMVTDASWGDLDSDGDLDLLVLSEWKSPTAFINDGGKLVKAAGLMPDISGFWRSVEIVDLNSDGQVEILLGNIGSNSKYEADVESPLEMYLGDLDGSGSRDIMLAYRQGSHYHPDRSFTYLKDQFPILNRKFTYYEEAAGKSIAQIFGPELDKATKMEINELRSVILSKEEDSFVAKPLPRAAQTSAIYDFAPVDVDADGDLDIVLAGNELYTPIQTGSYDAGHGLVLLNSGDGQLTPMDPQMAGIRADKWAKGLLLLELQGKKALMVCNNNEPPQFYLIDAEQLTLP